MLGIPPFEREILPALVRVVDPPRRGMSPRESPAQCPQREAEVAAGHKPEDRIAAHQKYLRVLEAAERMWDNNPSTPIQRQTARVRVLEVKIELAKAKRELAAKP